MKKTVVLAAFTMAGMLASFVSVAEDSGATKSSSTRPPRDLKKVGDHWTPWTPPPASPDDYIIEKGDTLWGLGQKWLGDPFLWPQIWDQNRYVQDSHWIYPGDPIVRPGKTQVVPPEGAPPSDVGNPSDSEPPPPTGGAPSGSGTAATHVKPIKKLQPLAWDHDVYCGGFIEPEHEFSDVWVAGREFERIGVGTGDVIFLNHGSNQGIAAGMDLAVIRQVWPVKHPVTEDDLGQMIQRLGKVRVLCAQPESAMGVIIDSCEAIYDSDELVPWRDIPIPAVTVMPQFDRFCAAASGGQQGYVVAIKDRVEAAGTGQIIHVDLGEGSGVQPGQFLSLYQDNGELPRRAIGQAMVLTIEPGTATAKVTMAIREAMLGDRVEIIR